MRIDSSGKIRKIDVPSNRIDLPPSLPNLSSLLIANYCRLDTHIDTTISVDGLLDDLVTVQVGIEVCDCLSTCLFDFFDYDLCSLLVLVVGRWTEIVDDNFTATFSQSQGVTGRERVARGLDWIERVERRRKGRERSR